MNINLAIIKNPISREVSRKQVPHVPGQPVFYYIKPQLMANEDEIEVFCGGKSLTVEEMRSIIPSPNDYIIAMPKIAGGGGDDNKSIVSTIAMIVIMMVAGPAGNAATAATSGGAYASGAAVASAGGMAAWNFWGYAAALGVQAAGGYLLNYFANKNKPDTEQGSATYSWNGVQPLTGQGQPVPEVFGTVRAAGQTIAEYVTSDGTKQYLNKLIQCAAGPCDYIGNGEDSSCTGISNIEINVNPISNYSGIVVRKRAGLNNQSVIPNFNNTQLDQTINIELANDSVWHTFTTTGDTGSGLEVVLMLPGLYSVYNGKRLANEVHIELEYQLTGTSTWNRYYGGQRYLARKYSDYRILPGQNNFPLSIGETIYLVVNGELTLTRVLGTGVDLLGRPWYEVDTYVSGDLGEIEKRVNYISISGKYISTFYRNYTINTGVVGQYDVRARCTYKYDASDECANKVYWSKLSHIVYDDFIYPNKTLLAIQALANDQISGQANVTFELTRSKVWVWVPTDPDLEPWGAGSYQELPANNPAWAAYWLNHRVYRLWDINTSAYEFVVRGAAVNRMVYAEFKAWADFCTDKGIEINIYFDTIQKIRDALKTIEELGRGRVLPRGTRIGCMFDGPAEKDGNGDIIYSQVFNVANIGLDSFSEQWVDVSERATAIECTFWNSENNHEREVMLVPGDGLSEGTANGNVTQLSIQASVPREVAWNYCKYKLRINNYINNTVSISSDVNAIVSGLGQVIGVQHDVPQWGYGGRVVSATTTEITLDKPVTMEADKTYSALFWLNNDTKIEKNVTLEPGETSVLTITEAFENDTLDADYVDSNLFWVDGDQSLLFYEGQLVHLFHETGDWTEYVISVLYDSEIGKTVVEVTNCPETLSQVRYDWTMPHENDQWIFGPVEDGIKKHCRPFKIMGFTRESDLRYRITAVNYEDAVYTEAADVPDIDYSSLSIIFEVENLSVEEETFRQLDGTMVSQLFVSWSYPVGKSPDRALIYFSEDGGITWFLSGETLDTKTVITNVKTNVSYLVKVVTFKSPVFSTGVISDAITIIGKDTKPSDVTSLTISQDDSMLTATITLVDDPDVDEYELRLGPSLANSYKVIPNFKGPASDPFKAPKEGSLTFWCRAVDRSGNYSENAISFTIEVFNIPPENAIYDQDVDLTTCTPTGMWFGLDGKWHIKTVEKIGDYPVFVDIFRQTTPWTFVSNPKLKPPIVDLGADVLEEGLYWIDNTGYIHLKTVERIGDYPVFADIFRQTTPWTLVQPKFVIKTFLSYDVEWNQGVNNRVDIFYRTKTDGDQWTDLKPSTETKFLGRQIDSEIIPVSLDGVTNVEISGINIQVDVPEVEEPIKRTDIPVEGLDYTYRNRYYIIPDPWVFCYDINGVVRMPVIANKTKTGCSFALLDDVGDPIAGRIAYGEVVGY